MSSGRSMRAVRGNLGRSFKEMYRELEEFSSTRAVETTPGASLNAGAVVELSSGLVSLVPHVLPVSRHHPWTRALEDQPDRPDEPASRPARLASKKLCAQ